jgi:hypothetical protein
MAYYLRDYGYLVPFGSGFRSTIHTGCLLCQCKLSKFYNGLVTFLCGLDQGQSLKKNTKTKYGSTIKPRHPRARWAT